MLSFPIYNNRKSSFKKFQDLAPNDFQNLKVTS